MPAISASSAAANLSGVPGPATPQAGLFGFALAKAMKSASVRQGASLRTARPSSKRVTPAMYVKSFAGS